MSRTLKSNSYPKLGLGSIGSSSGRSMLEMLGVLAIIGVLSVGALGGFKGGLNKHQENKIFDDANLQGLEILTNRSVRMNGDEILTPYSSEFIVSKKFDADRKNVLLKTKPLAESACQSLANKSNQGIFAEITCDTTNALTFKVPLRGKTYQIGSGNDVGGSSGGGSSGGGSSGGSSSGGGSSGGSGSSSSSGGGKDDDLCDNVTCNECQVCENGSCVANPSMNDLSCGDDKYCSYGDCLDCGVAKETCVGSDAWGSNGCQTHRAIECTGNTYCDEGTEECKACPATESCGSGECCIKDGEDICGHPTYKFGENATYKTNNANGCLVENTGCSLTNPADETQQCVGTCRNGDCIETCSTATTECVTACEKVNGTENKTYASNTTPCGTAGLCDGQGACVECSGVTNCTTYTNANGKCECTDCTDGYTLTGGTCIEELSCSELSCSNSQGSWCCAEPETSPITEPLACGENYGECTFNKMSCTLPNLFMGYGSFGVECCPPDEVVAFRTDGGAGFIKCCDVNGSEMLIVGSGSNRGMEFCCPKGSVAYYNNECVTACTNVENCSTYDTNCNCTDCEDGYTLDTTTGLCAAVDTGVCDARTTSSCTGTMNNCSYSCTPGRCTGENDWLVIGGLCSTGYCDKANYATENKICPLFDSDGNYIGYQQGVYMFDPNGNEVMNVWEAEIYIGYTERGNSSWADTCLDWDETTGPTGTKRKPNDFYSIGCDFGTL